MELIQEIGAEDRNHRFVRIIGAFANANVVIYFICLV